MSLITLYCGFCDRFLEVYATYSKGKFSCSECGEPLSDCEKEYNNGW